MATEGQSMAMTWQYLCWRRRHGSGVGSPGCSAFLTGIPSHASTAADEKETQSQRRSNAAASPTQALRTVPTAPWHSVQCKPMAQRRGAGENSVADRLLHSLRCSRARRKPPRGHKTLNRGHEVMMIARCCRRRPQLCRHVFTGPASCVSAA